MLELVEVTKTFPTGAGSLEILRGVDLRVDAGAVVALAGPSGTGKSTLLSIAGLLGPPSSGQVSVGGEVVSQDDASRHRARRRHMAFALQQPQLVPQLTAAENVELMMRLASSRSRSDLRRASIRALEQVGLADRAGHHPGELSGGEQQRVGIARALAVEPSVLLADEPTGSLDEALTSQVFQLFVDAAQSGIAVLVASHDATVVGQADESFVLRDGQLAAGAVLGA